MRKLRFNRCHSVIVRPSEHLISKGGAAVMAFLPSAGTLPDEVNIFVCFSLLLILCDAFYLILIVAYC